MPDSSKITMSGNLETWTCPECKESYQKVMLANDIVERIAKGVKRCKTCTHIMWEWHSSPSRKNE